MIHLGRDPRRVVATALTLLAVFASVVAPALAQAPVDPQSLLGDWAGQWQWKNSAKYYGQYLLTIDKVEGNNVSGTGQLRGRTNTEFKFRGKLEGNHLRFGQTPSTDLEIDGTSMSGSVTGGQNPLDLKLTKTKPK